MADYIYTMESRLTPDQQRGVSLVQDIARKHEMNVYLTGGVIRDIITGFPIHDLDFTVQGNALKLQKDLESGGAHIQGVDEDLRVLFVLLPGNIRAEISMARQERYDKPGKPPAISAATINEDLRRRDFTANAMALSLNPGSRGLLLDPFNGVADVEAKLIRILHNYAFLEEPSRLIRATRFAARFHWPLEERTQARYDAAKEGDYIQYINKRAIGYEIEHLAYEQDPINVMRALEREGWLKVLHSHWSVAKVDSGELMDVLASRQTMVDLGYSVDLAPAVMYFLTHRMPDKDIAEMQRIIPRKGFVQQWRNLEDEAKNLAKHLAGKEAATPSRTWQLLEKTRPETILFLEATTRQQGIAQKIKNYLTKWRQVRQKLPLPEMTELLITPQLPEYPKIANDVFMLMLDGKLRSRTEILKFLKPLAPPPPPPPPPPPVKRGRGAKAAAAAAGTTPPGVPAQIAAGAQPVAKRGPKPAKELVAGQQTKKLAKDAPAAGEPVTKPASKPAAASSKSAAPSSKPAAKEGPKKAVPKPEPKKAAKPAAKAAKKPAPAKPAKVKPAKKAAPAKKSAPKKKKK